MTLIAHYLYCMMPAKVFEDYLVTATRRWPHRVSLSKPLWHHPIEIEDWCATQLQGSWHREIEEDPMSPAVWRFEIEDDAILFRLRWC